MTVREYLKRTGWKGHITFIKARARKDANTPFYHPEYQTTLLGLAEDWYSDRILDSIVLNDKQPCITWLSGADWNMDIKRQNAKCLLIIHPDDLKQLYPGEKQRKSMIRYIDQRLST